jgi:hypothetical protein
MTTNHKPLLRTPDKPFYFNTSESLLRIGRQKAGTLSELLQAVRQCPDDSIFQQYFRQLARAPFHPAGLFQRFRTLEPLRMPRAGSWRATGER